MSNTYSIAHLAVNAYIGGKGMQRDGASVYTCDEGTADVVVRDGDQAVLMAVTAKRQRGEAKEPEYSAKRLQRIATCYIAEHPDVKGLRFDVLEALIGANATVTVNALEGAYSWER